MNVSASDLCLFSGVQATPYYKTQYSGAVNNLRGMHGLCVAVKIHAHKFYVEKGNTTKRKEGRVSFTLKYLKAGKCGRIIEF